MARKQSSLRRKCRRRGIRWQDVENLYRHLLDVERERRERAREVRQTSWVHWNAHRPRKWPFWRHGFAKQYGRRVERSDITAIRGYDLLAQEIGRRFPEYADAETLWRFLLSPYDRLPDRGALYERAYQEMVQYQARRGRMLQCNANLTEVDDHGTF